MLLLLLLLLTKDQVASKRMGKKDLQLKIKSRNHVLYPISVLFWPKFLKHMILLLRASSAECGVRWNWRWMKLESMRVHRKVWCYGWRLREGDLELHFPCCIIILVHLAVCYSSSILNKCEMAICFQRHKNLGFLFLRSVVFWYNNDIIISIIILCHGPIVLLLISKQLPAFQIFT